MLAAQVREKFAGGSGATGLHIFGTLTYSLNCFREVLPLPLQIGSQGIIKSSGRILATPFGVLFQLRFTFRLEWDHIHGYFDSLEAIVRRSGAQVKNYLADMAPATARLKASAPSM
jgi:hypothetical protein